MTSRNSPCPCGSGKRFKHCCGALGETLSPASGDGGSPFTQFGDYQARYRGEGMQAFLQDMPPGQANGLAWVPPGLMVLEDYLEASVCARWTAHFERQVSSPVKIQKVGEVGPGGEPRYVLDERRVTERVQMGELEQEIKRVLVGAYREVILPHYNTSLDWMERPDVLKYQSGGKYIAHSDNEYWDMENGRWIRSMDRDFSVLVYTNEQYEGGAVYFHNFGIRVQPKPGMLIAFPSDNRYLHSAEPITAGTRYGVVCWSSVKGREKLHPRPRGAI